jgi:hypothetical protein
VGITVKNGGGIAIDGGVSIYSCVSHGIEVIQGYLKMVGVVIGSGHGGAGCYAHSTSVVHITDGSPPTLTGTVGELAISDPAEEQVTWAQLDAGIKVSIAAENTSAKEV